MSETGATRYAEASLEALAATIHEEQAKRELHAACKDEGKSPELSAYAQQKRLAVYAASDRREEAAEALLRAWEQVTR